MLRTEHISRSTKRKNLLPLLGYEVANEIQPSMQQISKKVKSLVHGPSNRVFKYQSCSLNGVTYHTKERDNNE
ncbi:hypothetical protein ACS0TY_024402 [Phlomoides rotata]